MRVEIVDEKTHRTLAYIDALNRHGVKPLGRLVDEFARNPDHRVRVYRGLQAMAMRGLLDGPLFGSQVEEKESFCHYLFRVGWIHDDLEVELTKEGRALLKALNTPVLLDSGSDIFEIVLDPDNPFAYAHAIGALATPQNALLIDPYFRLDQLIDIAELNNITRVLVGTNLAPKDYEALATGLATLDANRNLSVRKADDLHDRYLISDDSGVLMFGTSLGGIGKKVSTMTTLGSVPSAALRTTYERVWKSADVIKPKQPAAVAKKTTTAKKTAPSKSTAK